MAAPRVIRVEPDSELADGVRHAASADEPLIIDTGDASYEVRANIAEHAPRALSPERVRRSQEAIKAAAGSWKDITSR